MTKKRMKKAPDMVDNRPRIRWDSAIGHFWCSGNGMLAAGSTPEEAYKSYVEMDGEISMFGMSVARIMQSEEKARA